VHFPNRYIDRTRYYKINELKQSCRSTNIGKIINIKTVEQKRGKRLVAPLQTIPDSELVWFQARNGSAKACNSTYPWSSSAKSTSSTTLTPCRTPEMELLKTHEQSLRSALQPVYPSTEALANKGVTNRVITQNDGTTVPGNETLFAETLPDYLMAELKLVPKKTRCSASISRKVPMHWPKAQFRLKFEELFFIQLQLITKNLIRKHKIKGHPFTLVGEYFNIFSSIICLSGLPAHRNACSRKSATTWDKPLR
jgi:ATP-dependent DNA helicase RecG